MFLKHKRDDDLIEVLTLGDLFDPCRTDIEGRSHCGEELQDPCSFSKTELMFPSGEELPQCWLDPDYRGTMTPSTSRAVLVR